MPTNRTQEQELSEEKKQQRKNTQPWKKQKSIKFQAKGPIKKEEELTSYKKKQQQKIKQEQQDKTRQPKGIRINRQ